MKKVLFPILALVLALALALPMAAVVGAAPDTATFGDDPGDWEKTANRLVDDTSDGVGDAPAWTDVSWGGWVTPAWDGPNTGIPPYSYAIPYWVGNDTWVMWSHTGTNWTYHTDQWFRTTVDIPATWTVTAVELLYKYNETIIPINDDLYVYVDDEYVAAGGTAGVPWVQAMIGPAPPAPTYGSNTFVAAVDPYSFAVAPETGWYLDGGLDLPPELFTPGSHDIHVLGEEFDINGGLGHLIIDIEYEEVSIEVEKDYRYTNVCFERDNDLDGLFNEDPVEEQIDNDGDGLFSEDPVDTVDNDLDGLFDEDPIEPQIDNDGDGLFGEDPVDCPLGTSLGTLLPTVAEDTYQLEAVIHPKNNKVTSYNPGQYYAVSTVTVLDDVDTLTIMEDWSDCAVDPISVLNPKNGGGSVVIVQVGPDDPDEVAYQILDATSDAIVVDAAHFTATATLEDVKAGTIILMYVKFGPGLKGAVWAGPYGPCENLNWASVLADPDPEEPGDWITDSAMLIVVEKE